MFVYFSIIFLEFPLMKVEACCSNFTHICAWPYSRYFIMKGMCLSHRFSSRFFITTFSTLANSSPCLIGESLSLPILLTPSSEPQQWGWEGWKSGAPSMEKICAIHDLAAAGLALLVKFIFAFDVR